LHEAFNIPNTPSPKMVDPTPGIKRAKRKSTNYPTFPISKYPTKVHETPKKKGRKGKEV
jgi:hypothetical protein